MYKTTIRYICGICVVMFIVSFFLCCSNSIDTNVDNDESHVVAIIPIFPWSSSRVLSDLLSEFYITSYSGRSLKGRNVHYTFDGSAWNADKTIVWPTGSTKISFWGLSQKFDDIDGITNTSMTSTVHKFDYTCDPANPKNLLYASKLNTTQAEQGGKITLAFNYALANPYFTCVQAIETENVTVIINEVIVHNLKTTGTFEYSTKANSDGTWKLNNDL